MQSRGGAVAVSPTMRRQTALLSGIDTPSGGVVLKKLSPAAAGAKRLTTRYGPSLVCVRYREDTARGRRLTTVELIVDERPLPPPLTAFRQEGEALVSNFNRLSQRRHDLVHGAVASLSAIDGAFVFAKLDVKEDYHFTREVRLEASEFPALTKDLIDLGRDATTLASKIWNHRQKPE